ncbi:MAG: PepSY domain-containing protein [Thaumarchaeota archaeon]|nr:MAG: PepSY domain-containing protein [Nitrososphaerota archaeon]
MDSKKAEEMATQFLQQHHSVLSIKKINLENGIWLVEVMVSPFGERTKKVRIDAKTGKIIGWQ